MPGECGNQPRRPLPRRAAVTAGRPGRCRKAVAEQHIDEGVEDTVEGDEITDRCIVLWSVPAEDSTLATN